MEISKSSQSFDRVEYGLSPAAVLKLVRDRGPLGLRELASELKIDKLPSNDYITHNRFMSLLAQLLEAGLLVRNGDEFSVTDILHRIQSALEISLTQLADLSTDHKTGGYVTNELIHAVQSTRSNRFDLSKLAALCREINLAFSARCYISVVLLLRAIINHVPPIFGHTSFAQVISHSSRSVKEILRPLEELMRDVADHHTHSLVRDATDVPTVNQIELFRVHLEILLQEVIAAVRKQED